MIELSLVLVVGGMIFLGLYKMIKNHTENRGYAEERAFTQAIDSGIKNSFLNILDAYDTRGASFVDTSNSWGWFNSPNTSPFPVSANASGLPFLDYRLDTVGLSAPQLANLRNEIVANFNGACSLDTTVRPRGDVRLFCPKLIRLEYNIGTTPTSATGHALGQTLNPENVPTIKVFYTREYPTSSLPVSQEEYDFSMSEIYNVRRSVSIRRLNTMRSAMEGFHNRTMIRELANSPTNGGVAGGLNSMDDEFVPWIWKALGDNIVSVNSINCAKTGGGVKSCTNLSTSNIWRSSMAGRGLYTSRIIGNLLGGDLSFALDGFNNPIYIYILANNCSVTTTNLLSCPPNVVPALPRDDYMTVGVPPFVSILYIPTANIKNTVAPDYARMYVSY